MYSRRTNTKRSDIYANTPQEQSERGSCYIEEIMRNPQSESPQSRAQNKTEVDKVPHQK